MQQMTTGMELAKTANNDMLGSGPIHSSSLTRRQGLYHCLPQAGVVDLHNGRTH